MPTRQAFAFYGFVVYVCAAAGAALGWGLLLEQPVTLGGALCGLLAFLGAAFAQDVGAHEGSRKEKARLVRAGGGATEA